MKPLVALHKYHAKTHLVQISSFHVGSCPINVNTTPCFLEHSNHHSRDACLAAAKIQLSVRMDPCVHIRVLIIPIHTHHLYWLTAADFTSGYSTLHLDASHPTMFGGGSEHSVPIVEVAYNDGKWWSIPPAMSAQLYEKHTRNEDAIYTWDWGENGRTGAWSPDGEDTKISRYKIDFVAGVQTNIDNNRKRSIRIVWVRPQDVTAQFTGQLPTTEQ